MSGFSSVFWKAVWVTVLFETEKCFGVKKKEFVFGQLILNLTVLLQIDFNDFDGGNFEPVGNLNNLLQLP